MTFPSFHDARLTGLAWTENEVRINFTFPDDKKVVVELIGVNRMVINGLREGNIVDEALLFTAENLVSNAQVVREWVEYLILDTPLAPSNPAYEMVEKSVQAIINDLSMGKSALLCISQSYGCELACLHKELHLNHKGSGAIEK
jgi:hypothetical protein